MSRQQPYENYENISKNFTEMCSMTETNSEHITSLISLLKSQNKSLQSLQSQVYKLQEKLRAEEDSERRDAECRDTEEDEEKVQVSEIFCDLCEDRHTALYHCKDCSENLCETIAGIHKKGKATKGHLVLLLSDIEKEPDVDENYEVPIYKESSKWNPSRNGTESEIILSDIYSIVFSRKGEIYLADSKRIPKLFTKTGNYIRQIYSKSSEYPDLEYGSMRIDSSDSLKRILINLSSDFTNPEGIFVQLSPKGEIFVVDIANHTVKVFSQERKFLRRIGKAPKDIVNKPDSTTNMYIKCYKGEFHFHPHYNKKLPLIQFTDNGNVYIQDKNRIQVFSEEGKFLYKVCECSSKYVLTGFAVSPSTGDVAVINFQYITGTYNIHIFEVTGKYSNKPESHFTLNTTLVQDSEILKDTKVSSVTFPISIKRDANDNLFTRTLYFREPIPVKVAINEVEEYFRKRITREEFNEVRSVCNFSSAQGDLRGDYMNWDACKKSKVIRGYFLGGEIIQDLTLNRGNLFIHITDCFITLK